jgi:crotonobetainyl-CoA:carnitine CoA-transferase CaiB-like acyl-CoA transferase
VRVLAIEQFGAGPWGTLQLADLGAEVIKIEDPAAGGDISRYIPPFQSGEDSLYFEAFNRNKRSLSLDLRHPDGPEVFRDLAAVADVVFSNLRGDLPHRLGLTYGQLKEVNPRIVCCSLTGFGSDGPRAAEPAYDPTIQALAGWMSRTGAPEDPPLKSGLSLVDFSAGHLAAISILAGLWRARREGVGCDCDLSLFEAALSQLNYLAAWSLTEGFVPPRRAGSAHPTIVPFQSFATADGYLVVACPKERFWEGLCRAMRRPDLASDPRFGDLAGRHAHRETLVPILEAELARRSSADWLPALAAEGVPCAPINGVAEALADPQVAARGFAVAVQHPRLGRVGQLASPLRVGEERLPLRPGPARGADTVEILRELCGYPEARLEELRRAGVFGAAETAGGQPSDGSGAAAPVTGG